MSVTIVLALSVKPELVEEIRASFAENLPDTLAYDGCKTLTVYSNQDDPTEIIVVEDWESKQHYEKYLSWRTETGMMEQLGTFLSAPPQIKYLDSVWASND